MLKPLTATALPPTMASAGGNTPSKRVLVSVPVPLGALGVTIAPIKVPATVMSAANQNKNHKAATTPSPDSSSTGPQTATTIIVTGTTGKTALKVGDWLVSVNQIPLSNKSGEQSMDLARGMLLATAAALPRSVQVLREISQPAARPAPTIAAANAVATTTAATVKNQVHPKKPTPPSSHGNSENNNAGKPQVPNNKAPIYPKPPPPTHTAYPAPQQQQSYTLPQNHLLLLQQQQRQQLYAQQQQVRNPQPAPHQKPPAQTLKPPPPSAILGNPQPSQQQKPPAQNLKSTPPSTLVDLTTSPLPPTAKSSSLAMSQQRSVHQGAVVLTGSKPKSALPNNSMLLQAAKTPSPLAVAKTSQQLSATSVHKSTLVTPTTTTAHKKPRKKMTKKRKERVEVVPLDLEPGTLGGHDDREGEQLYYCTKDNETLGVVAEKLGTQTKLLAGMPENIERYGTLKKSSIFRPGTLLAIPAIQHCSKWKIMHLRPPRDDYVEEECVDCGISSNPAIMFLCDGCDSLHHTHCVGLSYVPKGDWFCTDCLSILQARREEQARLASAPVSRTSLLLPHEHAMRYRHTLEACLRVRRAQELQGWREIRDNARQSLRDNTQRFDASVARLKGDIDTARQLCRHQQQAAMFRHGLRSCHLCNEKSDWIELADGTKLLKKREVVTLVGDDGRIREHESESWNKAKQSALEASRCPLLPPLILRLQQLEREHATVQQQKSQEQREAKEFERTHNSTFCHIELRHAQLLGEPRLALESLKKYKARDPKPRLLGLVVLNSDDDVMAMNMLREPDELILTVSLDPGTNVEAPTQDDGMEPVVGKTYCVFACHTLFDTKRDDELPLEANVRGAHRRLFRLLSDSQSNMIVTKPCLPPTVRVRTGECNRCFDLSELVRDCDVDLDLPKEPTPPVLAKSSLKLHDYQQSSLRWMLDKEMEGSNSSSMGLAGEFWHRLRFLDGSGEFFYCELTASFALNIFDFRADVNQIGASLNRFFVPTGGVLGEEMGLGKTVVTIALIASNPPPLQHRVLPREHIWSEQNKTTVNHPAYVPLPTSLLVPGVSTKLIMSNATLVVVPMTLLSQWEDEIKRFAPRWTVTVLHKSENPSIQTVATSDVVVATSSLIQSGAAAIGRSKILLQFLKRIHWHRLIIDEAHEAHMNTIGNQSKTVLAALSASHRHAVTGTPIGSQLSDFYGQVRFLRIAPFCRPQFWKNLIEEPYYDKNGEALRILRSLLSRIVIRHSKSQTFANGKSLLALPPRTVETVLLPFGNEHEKVVYQCIEASNRQYCMELKKISTAAVAARFVELGSLLTFARQACAHSSIVSLEALDRFHKNAIANKERKERRSNPRPGISSSGNPHDKTRAGLLEFAVKRARASAKIRMRVEITKFQHGDRELLECPVCFDVVGEEGIALPACAHPVCKECVVELFEATGTEREATGYCPSCRDIMKRSEVTFLSDATDAGAGAPEVHRGKDDAKPAADFSKSSNSNGFHMMQTDIHTQVTGTEASTLRVGAIAVDESELRKTILRDRALMHTLDPKLLACAYYSERKVGTKIARLLWEINEMTKKSATSKCVVFSQFLGILDVASEELQAKNISFVRIDGNMKQHERADSLMEFSSNPQIKVFLLSMRAGAVGLTLTAADHCFILDIAQNSAIEEQAIDRIHRIGQMRPVTVKRFVIKDTVEERILGARRSIAQDSPSSGTHISGTAVLDMEDDASRPAKRSRTEDGALDGGQRKQRVQMMEFLFGCASKVQKDR